ncbi:unnamed protein product [Spirodela intermedia]|uniref:Uncharacterized protein n=1 Tax=Spirodela intermedia TaxID=51605 RepID=A0A811G8I5_SPIIN|nr:unnamed protein product [Spirodela intermedia]
MFLQPFLLGHPLFFHLLSLLNMYAFEMLCLKICTLDMASSDSQLNLSTSFTQ